MTNHAEHRATLRRAATLIRRIDRFTDGRLSEDDVPARVIALELHAIANYLMDLEAIERVRETAEAEMGSRKAPAFGEYGQLQVYEGGRESA